MTNNKNTPQNRQKNPATPEQQRQSQRMEENPRPEKGSVNEDKRNQNNPNQPR